MKNANPVPYNLIPQKWAFEPEVGDFIRSVLDTLQFLTGYESMVWIFEGYQPDVWYYPQETLLEDGWTMTAIRLTQEYPAPVPVGLEAWISGYNGTPPAWGANSAVSAELQYGTRITTPDDGYVDSMRLWVDEANLDTTYSMWLVKDPDGLSEVDLIMGERTFDTVGWQEVATFSPVIALLGKVFDVLVRKKYIAGSTAAVYSYDYIIPQTVTRDPIAGEIIQGNSTADQLLVSKTDADAVDRSLALSLLNPGDTIATNVLTWTIAANVDSGTFRTFEVSPAVQSTPAGVQDFTVTTFQVLPLAYVEIPTHYTPNPGIEGFFSSTGYGNAVYDETLYGVDILVQDAQIPVDWAVVAPASVSGGTSQTKQLSSREVAFVRETSDPIMYAETTFVGNAWEEITRITFDADTRHRVNMSLAGNNNGTGYFKEGTVVLSTYAPGMVDDQAFIFGPVPPVQTQTVLAGNDLVFEAKGAIGETWTWQLVTFKRNLP